jgi:hypothetical protein
LPTILAILATKSPNPDNDLEIAPEVFSRSSKGFSLASCDLEFTGEV